MDTSVYVTRMIYAHRGKPLCEALPLKVKSIEFVSFSSAYFYRYIFSDWNMEKFEGKTRHRASNYARRTDYPVSAR